MRYLTDSIHIDSPPGPIWNWFVGLSEHYTEWHPDHVSAEWERGEPYQIGSIMKAVETLGGKLESLRFEMTYVDPPNGFEYKIRGMESALIPGGAFEISPVDGGSTFTARIAYRFGAIAETLFRSRMAALAEHMRQEGQNLKAIIEAATR